MTGQQETFVASPGGEPAREELTEPLPLGNLWIATAEHPEGSGRVPVVMRTENGDRLEASISADGLRLCAAYIDEHLGAAE